MATISIKHLEHYRQLKEKYREEILFFQVGNFIKMFDDAARKASEACGLKLLITGEAIAPIVTCGFPVVGLDKYVGKLVRKGFGIAICTQKKAEDGTIIREVEEQING